MSIRLKTIFVIGVTLFSHISYSATVEENGEYVVTASLTPVSKSTIGSALTVITSEDIKKRGVNFLPDILREVPGLAVNRSGTFGTQTDVRVRGAEANHTLVLIDGIEANDPSFGSSFQFAFLNAENIERIEVLRGAQTALWGSDAIGAVINIITKKGQGPLKINARFQGGSFDTQKSTLGGSYGNSLFNINLNADVLRTDGTNIARTGNEDDGHHSRTYDLKLGFTPGKLFDFNYVRRVVKSETQTDPTPFTSTVIVDAAGNQTDIDQVYQKAKASVSLFENHWNNHFSFVDTKNRTDFASTVFGASFLNGDKTKYSFQSDLNFNTTSLVGVSHDVSFLTEYEDDNATGSFIGGASQVGFITRSYAGEYRVGILERLFISTGIRHDDNDFFDDETTYRVTGALKLTETDSRIHISYGTGVKNPTISELFGNFPTFTGNPNLTPESSRGWDIGVEQNLFDDKLNFDITYFKNLIADQITGSNQTVTNSNGTNKIQGIEVAARLSPVENLDINATYTFTDSEDANGLDLVRRAQHIGNMNLNYSFYEDKANLNLGVNYNGTQIDNVFPPFPTPSFRAKLDSFTVVNLSGSYKWNKYLSLFGRIENLTDESYEEVFGFTSPGVAGYAGINLTLNPQ
jgi:vitamin B12 transporter